VSQNATLWGPNKLTVSASFRPIVVSFPM
jgi:hypothetical protein